MILALIPEAVAFAFVAHVEPMVGLYAVFIMGLITALVDDRGLCPALQVL
nr:SulP family inorganic anion transporter [Shewanella sp. 11B5]